MALRDRLNPKHIVVGSDHRLMANTELLDGHTDHHELRSNR